MFYRRQMQSSLSVVLVSTLQARIANGKTFDEIKEFNASLAARRKQKLGWSRLRQQLQNIVKETDKVNVEPSMSLSPGVDDYFGIQQAKLSTRMAPYAEPANVKQLVSSFFAQYCLKKCDLPLLNAFNTLLKNIKPIYVEHLNQLNTDESIDWTNKQAVQAYLDSLSPWLDEEEKLKKEKKEKKDKDKDKEQRSVIITII
jgi:hypothetical protein